MQWRHCSKSRKTGSKEKSKMSTASSFAPLATGTGQTLNLSMQRLWLTGRVLPAGARVVVEHVFRCNEEKPLEVIYAFPLPRDAALRSFRISGEGFEAHSELKEVEAAVEAYEKGLSEGSLAGLARTYGDGLVNLTVGNIRPGETVTVRLDILCGVELKDDGFRFRFPFTLAPAYHARAKTAMPLPGEGEIELPADEFGDVILPRFRQDASGLHEVGFELIAESGLELEEVGSPSHSVRVKRQGDCSARIALSGEKDVPDRDLVLDVGYRSVEPQVFAGRDKDGVCRFAAIVPSTVFGAAAKAPRRVVILLDRSGSMRGAPIAQAHKAIEACLGALSETDLFGLVAFDNALLTFRPSLVPGTREMRDQAHAFLAQAIARGGTDLVLGFHDAARMLEGAGGDILVLTDGQVSGTEAILDRARSTGVRLHCLGIGSASQDRFLALLARETGGVSRFVTPRERIDLPAVDLFASMGQPIARELKAGTNILPEPSATVFRDAPVLLFGEDDRIDLTWAGGQWGMPVSADGSDLGQIAWLLQGSRLITDWESRYPSADAISTLGKRRENRVARRLIELSRTYGLASREMALVCVVKRAGDQPGQLPETRVVSVGMPQDTHFGAYFANYLRESFDFGSLLCQSPSSVAPTLQARGASVGAEVLLPITASFKSLFSQGSAQTKAASSQPPAADDVLLDLASRIDSDGGMPGRDNDFRAIATIVALLAFLSQGHTARDGVFRSHVARLMSFLGSCTGLSAEHRRIVAAVMERARKGRPPAGDWIALAGTPGDLWGEVEKACNL
jgi:hypothetical protein